MSQACEIQHHEQCRTKVRVEEEQVCDTVTRKQCQTYTEPVCNTVNKRKCGVVVDYIDRPVCTKV